MFYGGEQRVAPVRRRAVGEVQIQLDHLGVEQFTARDFNEDIRLLRWRRGKLQHQAWIETLERRPGVDAVSLVAFIENNQRTKDPQRVAQ